MAVAPPRHPDPVRRMDRMYRWTRHVYDATRRYYLLGRDRMLDDVAARPAGDVVEVGCGTARNLRHLASIAPHHRLYGLDASHQMLDTARRNLQASDTNAHLIHGLAENLRPALFEREARFDVVVFSYVLSMLPTWKAAVDAGLRALPPGGTLYVVDFWDQAALPSAFATLLQRWLALFGVHHRPELLDYLRTLDADGTATLTVTPVARRYAYIARLDVPA